MKKRMAAMMMAAVMAAMTAAGCGTGTENDGTGVSTENNGSPKAPQNHGMAEASKSNGSAEAVASSSSEEEDSYLVGISQFAEHGSLDNCREGFLAGLEEAGIVEGENLTVLYENAQTDTGTASLIAENFVSQKADMICAIATPCAMSAYNICMETDIPVVYTAISDPVGAGLAAEDGSSVGNITGSSDLLPVSAQLEMIRTMLPQAKTIGILYTTSEANSVSTIETYKELAPGFGFEIIESGVSNISEVDMAAADLVTKVDCISNLTDNTVVEALQTVLDKANTAGIPVFGSEIEQVKSGCVASMGIEYFELGRATGQMAARILKGEAAAGETPFIRASTAELYVNFAAAEKIHMELDESYVGNAAKTFDEIMVE
ncbi:MAG: ABC transporter substrate-binding protein [Lachnospiraceae bacterium]|nr:ABC transporter substrate-binding protein [Lachnospiraceae bacterium]